MLLEMREVYSRPSLQAAVKAAQPAEGLARASRGTGVDYLVALKGLVSPLQDPVFARHGYPPNPAGVAKMKADADAAVLAGDGVVARLSNELHVLLGLVPIGRGVSPGGLHPQFVAMLERRAAEVTSRAVEALLVANDAEVILAEIRRLGVLSPEEERQLREASDAEVGQLLQSKLWEVNFKKTKNRCVREFLKNHPERLGVEPSRWRSVWAEEAVAKLPGGADRLVRDGFVVLDGALDARTVTEAAAEVAQMHESGELTESTDVCNRGAKAVFLNFGARVERAYHLGAVPGLAALAERIAGLPDALAQQDRSGVLSTMRLDASVMVSAYEAGVSYRRHMDSYGGDDNHRMLTVLAYLNDYSWDEESAGALRLYKDLAPEGKVVSAEEADAGGLGDFLDVLPLAGRVVLFLSRRVWHEVRPAERNRYAMTLWVPAPVPPS
mmetsp:Transcript_8490/g.27047  ORF Transcript_8490/g.27047 Transcript_8490/m.27047 type:complete len:440 (-) Transcript_8490:48-1367(-)